ncbi:hypothetical protein B0H14DRAFT_3176932 [Mycena olivaceomarginata]|nr:hypothetical protein B0H14DRAFT_3176932 [Mycena olivaceomarginata]
MSGERCMSLPGQSFEEVRFADYLKSYRATGRPPPSSPPYPSEPKARAAQGLPPLFTPVTLPAVPSSSSPSSTVPSTTSSPAAIATPLSTAAIPNPTRPGVQPTVTPMGRFASESLSVNPSGSDDKASAHPTPMGGFVSGGLFGNLSSSGDKAGIQPMPTNRFTSTPSPFTSGSLLGHFQPPASEPSTSSGGGNLFRFGDKAGAQPTSTNGFTFTPSPFSSGSLFGRSQPPASSPSTSSGGGNPPRFGDKAGARPTSTNGFTSTPSPFIRPFTPPPSRFTSGSLFDRSQPPPSSLSAGFGDGNRFNSGDKAGTEPMSTNQFERTSSHLAKNLGGIEKVEQEGDVMEMARTSEQIRRHELDELLRAQQAETDSGTEGGYVYVSPPAATKAFYDISVALSLYPPTIGPGGRVRRAVFNDWLCGIMELHAELLRAQQAETDSGTEGEYIYVDPPAATKAFYDISVALSLSAPTIGPQGRVRRAVLDDWLCGIMELHAELSRDRKLQSEAEQMFTELAESLEEIKKVEQEREGELARHRQEILDQQSEIKHTSSQLAQSLGKIEKVEQERDVMEMACKSERMHRVELEEQLRERQTGVGILQDDLAKCRETIQRVEQERESDLARHQQEIHDVRSRVERMSSQLMEHFGKIEEVEKERLVMEMARNAEQMRRLELEERFRARQAEAVALQRDLEQARGRCSELEAELKRTKVNDEARKDEEISSRNAAREEGRDDMLTEIIQLLNSKRENDQRAKQAEKDRVEKERAEKMRKAERELAEELERSRCQKRDEKYKNARIWTDALAFDRFETILVVEEFTKIKFCASKPLTFEALPWPVLARPGTYAANDITADHVRAFFRTPVATSAKSATHPIPAEYRKYLVKQGLLAFHGDKMVARISTVEDEALCQQILEAANIITQTLNEIMPRA